MVPVSWGGANHGASAGSSSSAAAKILRGLLNGCDLRRISIHALKAEVSLAQGQQERQQWKASLSGCVKVVESKLEQGCKHSEAGQNGKGKGLRSNLAKVAGRIDDFTWYSLEEWDEKTSFERVHSIIPFVLAWAGYVLYCIHGGIRKERLNQGSVSRWDWGHAGPWVKECLCKNSVLYIMI